MKLNRLQDVTYSGCDIANGGWRLVTMRGAVVQTQVRVIAPCSRRDLAGEGAAEPTTTTSPDILLVRAMWYWVCSNNDLRSRLIYCMRDNADDGDNVHSRPDIWGGRGR
jgi:hypothetical protein